MPLINQNEINFPDWCEVEYYNILELKTNEIYSLKKKSIKEKLFICEGECFLNLDEDKVKIFEKDTIDLTPFNIRSIETVSNSIIILVGGHWGDELGSADVFTLDRAENPFNEGDTANYDRNTYFDNHFHDFDEYWIIFKGSGTAVSEKIFYDVNAGDCVATKMGDHHDFPIVKEKIHGVYFETTLKGDKRLGHLWERSLKKIE
jgi:mannose-6-phosphate isomerase-like protein (cupin superfamily)